MQYDLTELDGLDYLSSPEGPILQAQQLAAEAWGAEKTWFLVNGTTVGVHAAILATCSSDSKHDALIVARNAHQSAFNAAALAGCHVEYAMPSTAYGLAHHVTPPALEEAFKRAKTRGLHPKAAFVVSPTYFGVVSDIKGLVEVCHRHGAVLIVDEAHGAHLHFLLNDTGTSNASKSNSALHLGADVVIQSTHKLLGALTQGAMLHLNKTTTSSSLVDLPAKISRALSILQTSSPSYLIMASLDAARAQVQDPEAVKIPHAAATALHSWFLNYKKNRENTILNESSATSSKAIKLTLLTTETIPGGKEARMDPWRFTVLLESTTASDVSSSSSSSRCSSFNGWDVAALLERECGVVSELATNNSVVFAVGMGTTMKHAEALIRGLEWLHSHLGEQEEEEEKKEKQGEKDTDRDEVGQNKMITSAATDDDFFSIGSDYSIKKNDILKTDEIMSLPEIILKPREALSAATERIPWTTAAVAAAAVEEENKAATAATIGRISAELLCPYPPGIAAIYPGERFDQHVLDMLLDVVEKGGKVVGAADKGLKTVRVVVE
jgi:arginine/lysine/ornithine decarboxylase